MQQTDKVGKNRQSSSTWTPQTSFTLKKISVPYLKTYLHEKIELTKERN